MLLTVLVFFFFLNLECTEDQYFVFAIRAKCGSVPLMTVDLTKLVIPGHPNCKPVIVTDKAAIFKFKVTECGARAFVSLSSVFKSVH